MTIKHLVISGGGPTGIKALGALQQLEKNNFWKIDNIETIYATSAGSIIALLIAMKFEWDYINDYIIKRPWHEVYNIGINHFFEAFSKKGLFDKNIFEIFFKPFFKAKDLSMDITMKDFYEYSNIELHFFSLEINQFESIDISYKTHPDLNVLTAIHMSSALPIIISPVCIDNKCYIDGGVVSNYPLDFCINNENVVIDEILGFRNDYENIKTNNIVNNESTILDYIMNFINRLIMNVDTEKKQQNIPNEVEYKTRCLDFSFFKTALSCKETRNNLLKDGIESADIFLSKQQNIDIKNNEKYENNF